MEQKSTNCTPNFPVVYEIYPNSVYAQWIMEKRELEEAQNKDAADFVWEKNKTPEEVEKIKDETKARTIKFHKDRVFIFHGKLQATDFKKQYKITKQYFERKAKELGLKNPRIFYDDAAFRIDIGYDSKEFLAIFPDFNSEIGQKARPQGYENQEKEKKTNLLSTADQAFSQPLPIKKPVTFATDNLNIQSESTLIETCLSVDSGIVIGEIHGHKSPKQFLIDHMATFQAQGVTQLYMEHLLDSHQALLDAYWKSPEGTPLPEPLACYLKLLDTERRLEGRATFTSVVQTAKAHGIRIIAIDTETVYKIDVKKNLGDLNKSSADRYKAMNFMLLERFKQYNDNQKYVVFCGSGHASTCEGVPGVADLLGCHNIIVHDVKPEQAEKLQANVNYCYDPREKKHIHFDFLYERDSNPKKEALTAPLTTENANEISENVSVALRALYDRESLIRERTGFGQDEQKNQDKADVLAKIKELVEDKTSLTDIYHYLKAKESIISKSTRSDSGFNSFFTRGEVTSIPLLKAALNAIEAHEPSVKETEPTNEKHLKPD